MIDVGEIEPEPIEAKIIEPAPISQATIAGPHPDANLQRLAIAANQVSFSITTAQFPPMFTIDLTPDQRHYLRQVLRLRPGDRFIALLAEPIAHQTWWLAELTAEPGQAQSLGPLAQPADRLRPIWLLAALPKGSGFDEVVRQAIELGASHIVPVLSDRTLVKPSPAKVDRWRRIAQEAAEQAERATLPQVNDPIGLAGAIALVLAADRPGPVQRYWCEPRQDAPHLLDRLCQDQGTADRYPDRPIVIAIGPEGGWTDQETQTALAARFQLVSLGSRILRAVTAPLAAIAIVASWQEAITH